MVLYQQQSNNQMLSLRNSLLFICLGLCIISSIVTCVDPCTSDSCGVRQFLSDLKAERDKIYSTYQKISKGIDILNGTLNNATLPVINARVKQLAKVKSAMSSLDMEIDVINTRCATTIGPNCDSCATGYTNFPTCNVPTCSGVSSLNTTSVCSGKGLCVGPNTCNCTLPYYGSNCQNTSCTSFPTLTHKYLFLNNDGQDDFGMTLNTVGTGVSYSSSNVPAGIAKSATFTGPVAGGLLSSNTVNFGAGQSIAFWMKKNNVNVGIAWSIGVSGPYIEFTSSGQAFNFFSCNNQKMGDSGLIFTNDSWRHIAMVFNTNSVDLYLDGSFLKSMSSFVLGTKTGQFMLGCYSSVSTACSTSFWAGSMANVLYFNSALTAAEVQTVYKTTYIC